MNLVNSRSKWKPYSWNFQQINSIFKDQKRDRNFVNQTYEIVNMSGNFNTSTAIGSIKVATKIASTRHTDLFVYENTNAFRIRKQIPF